MSGFSHVVASDRFTLSLAVTCDFLVDLAIPAVVHSRFPLRSACHGHCNTNLAGECVAERKEVTVDESKYGTIL